MTAVTDRDLSGSIGLTLLGWAARDRKKPVPLTSASHLLQHHLSFESFDEKSNKNSGTPRLISSCLISSADRYTISV